MDLIPSTFCSFCMAEQRVSWEVAKSSPFSVHMIDHWHHFRLCTEFLLARYCFGWSDQLAPASDGEGGHSDDLSINRVTFRADDARAKATKEGAQWRKPHNRMRARENHRTPGAPAQTTGHGTGANPAEYEARGPSRRSIACGSQMAYLAVSNRLRSSRKAALFVSAAVRLFSIGLPLFSMIARR